MGNWFSSPEQQSRSASQEDISPRSKFATPSVSSRSLNTNAPSAEGSSSTSQGTGGMRKIEKVPNPSRGFRGGSNHSLLK